MKTKIVSQTDENGFFVEAEYAYESPLQPGHFPLPAGAVDVTPPSLVHNQRAKWNGEQWDIINVAPVIDEEAATATVAKITWDVIRYDRNRLLSYCDWTQLPDVPHTQEQKTAWLVYRQALRDITKSFKNPTDVIWPTSPNSLDEIQ
jgi:hypothetical protein